MASSAPDHLRTPGLISNRPCYEGIKFVSSTEAQAWMTPSEQVIGLEIEGETKAYPINMLSRHEIVDDVVGGKPVAVTW